MQRRHQRVALIAFARIEVRIGRHGIGLQAGAVAGAPIEALGHIEAWVVKHQARRAWEFIRALGEQGICRSKIGTGAKTHQDHAARLNIEFIAHDDPPNRTCHIIQRGGKRVFRRQAVLDTHHVRLERISNPRTQGIACPCITERETATMELEYHRTGIGTKSPVKPAAAHASPCGIGREPIPRTTSPVELPSGLAPQIR